MTDRNKVFIKYYTKQGDTFLNATLSYAEAYDYKLDELSQIREKDSNGNEIPRSSEYEKAYQVCSANGHRLLLNDEIGKAKDEALIEMFNNDNVFDAKIAEITERGKYTDAIQAIKHRNELKQRVTKKLDITTNGRPLAGLTDEELAKMAE